MSASLFAYAALAMIGSGLAIGVFTLGRNKPEDTPRLGMRGKKRARAMETGGLFASSEPMIRMVDAAHPDLWLESCAVCYGTFFDAGEFREFADHRLRDMLIRNRRPRPL